MNCKLNYIFAILSPIFLFFYFFINCGPFEKKRVCYPDLANCSSALDTTYVWLTHGNCYQSQWGKNYRNKMEKGQADLVLKVSEKDTIVH